MGVYKEGKNWKVQVYYKDWQGNRKRKQKRGFRTKGEAKEWERDFLQQQSQGVDIEFGNFLEIYYKDMDVRLRENTMYTKRYIIDLKIKPYFEKKILSEITVADVRAWQNELLTYKDKNGKGYSPTYLKTVNCQLTAIFNYAMRYYNLQDNPCRKAGAIGKSKGEPKDFWMQEEFNAFLETVSDKPETRMAFLLLYWTGMRIGELLALTYNDINLEEKTISINKSYAPPYSSAKDPVNMAGFMIDNIAKGTLKQWHLEDMDKISKDKSVVLLDVRTVGEFNRGHMDGFRNIPVDELRERINEIEKGKPVYLICQSGLRSYIASRILEGNGYETYNFSGGFRFYDAVVNDRALIERAYACGMDY